MKLRITASTGALAALLLALTGQPVAAQGGAHTHLGHVAEAFSGTPTGDGLLQVATEEAAIAAQHARLAANDDTNLEWMQTHAAHVLHAVDPGQAESGPGLGYGVVQAAEGIVQHITLAAESDDASENVRTHATHVAAAAEAVAERGRRIAELAAEVGEAGDYSTAGDLIRQIRRLSGQLMTGIDADEDGSISWGGGEGGLEQVVQHVNLMRAGEGLD